jgi:hypothetical protein
MFVGHEFLAFALAGSAARLAGRDARSALLAGGVAALCALLPDLDVAYGLGVYLLAVSDGVALSWDAFWGVANGVHRVVTHPLPVGVAATLCFASAVAVTRRVAGPPARGALASAAGGLESIRRGRAEGASADAVATRVVVALAAAALVVAGTVVSTMANAGDGSAAVVAVTYLGVVGVAGAVVARRLRARSALLAFAAGVGFLTHPFGDVLMAAPPPLLAPFAASPLTDRVVFSPDDTVNLLAVLFAEVTTVWAGLLTYLHVTDRRLRDAFAGRAVVGVGYASAAFVLPRPTMVDAHYLGFTVVPLAVVVGATAFEAGVGPRTDRAIRGLATGLATLTVAALAYLVTYLVA